MDTTVHTPTRITDFGGIDLEVRQVAHGGFGVVYMGPNRLANRAWRALKTIERGCGQRVIDAFVREALIWRGLWPLANLLPTYGVTHIRHHPYIILPYAEHGNLRAHLGRRESFAVRLEWAQMIASGLVALHIPDPELLRPWPIVHRDLKPENILINSRRLARISDFGLARALELGQTDTGDDNDAVGGEANVGVAGEEPLIQEGALQSRRIQTERGEVVGTPAYMAPEQWRGSDEVGTPTDMYAFGVILSELLTGRHPLIEPGAPHLDWPVLHAWRDPIPLRNRAPEASERLEALYFACLEKRPQARPTAAEALATLRETAETRGERPWIAPEYHQRTRENLGRFFLNWSREYGKFAIRAEKLERSARAFELLPDDPFVLIYHGQNISGTSGQYDEGFAMIKRSLDMDIPDSARAEGMHKIALLLGGKDKFAEADAAWHALLSKYPHKSGEGDGWRIRATLHVRWARQEWESGRMEEARGHLLRAQQFILRSLKIDHDHPTYTGFYHAIRQELIGWGVTEPWTYLCFIPGKDRYSIQFRTAKWRRLPTTRGTSSDPPQPTAVP